MPKTISQQEVLSAIDIVGQNYNPTLTSVMKGIVEQSTNFRNVNTKDSVGAFGINPAILKRNKDVDPFDPVQAATLAFDTLEQAIKSTGTLETGIAAYAGGLNQVNRFNNGKGTLDSATAKFVPQVMARANKYEPGVFDLEKITAAANKVGYRGKADFEALAGGKRNILPKNTTMIDQSVEPMLDQAAGAMPVDQSAAMLNQPANLPSIDQVQAAAPAPTPVPDVAQAAQAIQPQVPQMSPGKEAEVAGIFGMQPEAQPAHANMLPEGLLADIRKAIAAA